MKTGVQSIDGFAIQNTTCVLCALGTYERLVETKGRVKAIEAAITCYENLVKKRVTERTIRRWLHVVKGYGGIEKTPENAFGARKSCHHLKRPVRDRLRQIQRESEELSNRIKKQEYVEPTNWAELALIDKALTDCLHQVLDNKPIGHLASIKTVARRLETTPIYKLCKYVSVADTESVLEELLARLRILATNQRRKAT